MIEFEWSLQRFEWDPAKNESNVAKHGISFQTAAAIFDGPMMIRRSDRDGEE